MDCTLRDGGFELEDAAKYGQSQGAFTSDGIRRIAECLTHARIDIIELGLIESSPHDRRCFSIYPDIEAVSQAMPETHAPGQMYTAMYRGPDTPVEEIPAWSPRCCEGVRVMLRYSELEKSLEFCRALSGKGYRVFLQPSVTARYTEEELQMLIDAANGMQAYALYFVDTYGYFQPQDIRDFFRRFDAGLDASVRIGFHAHNNRMLALPNALEFLSIPTERRLILDACLLGFGQGGGNLQTEIITDYMNARGGGAYDYGAILDGCEQVEPFCGGGPFGYSVTQLLPALHRTAYRYSTALREGYGLSYREIDRILGAVPEELRHRYTPENTARLLAQCGYPAQRGQAT